MEEKDPHMIFSDFASFKPCRDDSDSDTEEDEVDQDLQDMIYAQMFFTGQQSTENDSKDPKKKMLNKEAEGPKSESNNLRVSLVLEKNHIDPQHMTKTQIRALKRRKSRKRNKQNKLPHKNSQDSSSSAQTVTDNTHTKSVSESPLATNSLKANSSDIVSVRRASWSRVNKSSESKVDEAGKTKGSRVKEDAKDKFDDRLSKEGDVILISDSEKDLYPSEPKRSDEIVISSDAEYNKSSSSDSEDSLLFDNLLNLSSSSEDSEDNMDLCNKDDMDEEVIDDWAVCKKDLMGRDAYERLYEKKIGERPGRYYGQKVTKCSNCKQRGHLNKDCPWPKRHQVCYMCAGLNHVSSRCPKNKCSYCYQPQHRGRRCIGPSSRPSTSCNRCYMQGHHASICPDQWRQYHNTNYLHNHLVMIPTELQRSSTKVFCYNCSAAGHYGFECTKTLPRGWPRPHLPLIAKYDIHLWPPRYIPQIREQLKMTPQPSTTSKSPSSSASSNSRKCPPQEQSCSKNSKKHSPHEKSMVKDSRKRTPKEQSNVEYELPPSSNSGKCPPQEQSCSKNSKKHSPLEKSLAKDSRKRTPKDQSNVVFDEYELPPRKQRKQTKLSDSDRHRRVNGFQSGNYGDQRELHRDEDPDLREFLSERRQSNSRWDDFPRVPLLSPTHHRNSFDDFRRPLLPPPPLHYYTPPPLHTSHMQPPILHTPTHRRYSDVTDRRPDYYDNVTRSNDYYEASHRRHRTRDDGHYMSDRGFIGSKETAYLLDSHESRRGYRY